MNSTYYNKLSDIFSYYQSLRLFLLWIVVFCVFLTPIISFSQNRENEDVNKDSTVFITDSSSHLASIRHNSISELRADSNYQGLETGNTQSNLFEDTSHNDSLISIKTQDIVWIAIVLFFLLVSLSIFKFSSRQRSFYKPLQNIRVFLKNIPYIIIVVFVLIGASILFGAMIKLVFPLLFGYEALTDVSPSKDVTSNILSHTENILAFVAVLLAVFAIFFAGAGYIVKRGFNLYRGVNQKLEALDDLVITSAKLTLASLPEYSASQQIPLKSREALKKIVEVSDIALEKHKNNLDNVTDILIAQGIYHFAENKLTLAIRHFEKIIDFDISKETKETAKYHLGMILRQQRKYERSRQYFCDAIEKPKDWPQEEVIIEDFTTVHFYSGLAITFYIEGNEKLYQSITVNKKKNNQIDNIFHLWNKSCKLFSRILEKDPDNALALNGMVKLAFRWRELKLDSMSESENDDKKHLDMLMGNKKYLENYCRRYIDLLSTRSDIQEDLLIKANWYLCMGITAKLYRSLLTADAIRKTENQKYIQDRDYIGKAEIYANFIDPNERIYSEEQERLVERDSFIGECGRWL